MLISIPKSITRLSPPKTYPHPDKLIGLTLIFVFILSWSNILNGNVLTYSMSRIPAEPIKNSTLGVRTPCIMLNPLLTVRTVPGDIRTSTSWPRRPHNASTRSCKGNEPYPHRPECGARFGNCTGYVAERLERERPFKRRIRLSDISHPNME